MTTAGLGPFACDNQHAIQFDDFSSSAAATWTIRNNVDSTGYSWDGSSYLYGCYSGTCSYAGMTVSGNTKVAQSPIAPPLP